MKIDFTKIQVRKSLSSDEIINVDMRASFADVLYTRGSGIEAHALAFKIYNSDTEYSDKECEMIRYYTSLCAPFFIDAINEILK